MEVASELVKDYLWYKDWFYLYTKTESTREGLEYSFLQASMDVGDCIDDEWTVSYILLELSKRFPNLVVYLLSLFHHVCRFKCVIVMVISC